MARMTAAVTRHNCVKYNDPEFTDLEVEVLMKYFGIFRYEQLVHTLREMKSRHLEMC
jgi:hypothetical protein